MDWSNRVDWSNGIDWSTGMDSTVSGSDASCTLREKRWTALLSCCIESIIRTWCTTCVGGEGPGFRVQGSGFRVQGSGQYVDHCFRRRRFVIIPLEVGGE